MVHCVIHVPSSGSQLMLTSKGTRWLIPLPMKTEQLIMKLHLLRSLMPTQEQDESSAQNPEKILAARIKL
ncbi:hypothetical protein TNCV_3395881 [Trichonephila clavipes]|nr:hypothetical protein TNCV_3395881 [Trichonephila clavipes]